MRIAVFGATGTAGSAIVTEAVNRGHQVVACSRRPYEDGRDHLITRVADAADPVAVAAVLTEVDVAVLTIRLTPGEESRLAPITDHFLAVAAEHGTRVVIVGGAAALRSPLQPDRLIIDDPAFVPQAWQTIARASLDQYRTCQQHTATGWTYLSPSAILEPGDRGEHRRGTTTLLTDEHGTSRVRAGDLAVALVDELEHPRGEQHFTVASV